MIAMRRLGAALQGRAIACLFLLVASGQAATYYVDSTHGSDANSGTSAGLAWQTLAKVNAAAFQPGDRILFRAGGRWRGQLAPKVSGTEGAAIIFDRYGDGPKPLIDGAGEVEEAVRLYNVQYIELRNLAVTNRGAGSGVRRGVDIFLDNFGTARHIVVAALYVFDVNGSNERKDTGGIIFRANGDRKPSRFHGLVIERNIVWKVDRQGIAGYTSFHWRRTHWNPSVNVVIRDNLVEDIGGDGIVPWATDGALIEHNIARHCNRRAASYNAGIWPFSADNTLLQLNEASFTHGTTDGQGFDSDYNSRNTLFQYNYSHDNEGGFMLICTPGQRKEEENVGNVGTVVRHNISRNDRTRIFTLSGEVRQTTVEENAIYIGPGLDVQAVIVTDWKGWPDGALFRGNRFHAEGIARYGHGVSRRQDGTYEMAAGWGPAKNIRFEGNRYAGRHIGRPEDDKATAGDLAQAADAGWEVPVFDPARPDGFDAFLARHRAWMLRLFERQFGFPPRLGR